MADSARRGFWNTNEQSVHRSHLSRLASRSSVCAGFIRLLPQSGQRTYRSMNKSDTFTNAIPIIDAAAPRISKSLDHVGYVTYPRASDTSRLDLEPGLIGEQLQC